MPKEIKRCYDYLDLDYDSTKEEINDKYNKIIEKLSQKELKFNKKCEKKRKKIDNCYNLIQNFINEHGTNYEKRSNLALSDLLMQAGILILLLLSFFSLIDKLT